MRVHDDKLNDKTYSIKVGKTIPPNSVNLAYVDATDLNPEYNVEIYQEQPIGSEYSINEFTAKPDTDFLLHDMKNNNPYVTSRKLEITDEFSIKNRSDSKVNPLYYRANLSQLFDINNKNGIIQNIGYTEDIASVLINSQSYIPSPEDNVLLYLGDNIRVTKNGTAVDKDKYKVVLTRVEGTRCSVTIYANFKNSLHDKYEATYQSVAGIKTETLNCYTFFAQDDDIISDLLTETDNGSNWDERLDARSYSIKEKDGKYQIYVPSHLLVADKDTRPSQKFRYKIDANLDVRYGVNKPCTIKIGLAYYNTYPDTVLAENLTDILAKVYDRDTLPSYVTLVNPHPSYAYITNNINYEDEKDNPNYWLVNLDCPEEFINDYDVIIITGYGAYDITNYNHILRRYLETGGSLWIDNGGNNELAFNPGDSFVVDLKFSNSIIDDYVKIKSEPEHKLFNRIWNINAVDQIGYQNVAASIVFGPSQTSTDWNHVISYDVNEDVQNPCIIEKVMYGKGLVVISNCGIMRSVHANEGDEIKLFVNMIMRLKEDMWVHTPWINDNVLHKDNVFAQELDADKEGFYDESYRPEDTNTRIARKMLHRTALDGIKKFVDIDADIVDGNYSLRIEQLKTNGNGLVQYEPATTVYSIPLQHKNRSVYIYTLTESNNTFNITSEGLKNGFFSLHYEALNAQYTVFSFYYEWDRLTNTYKKQYKSSVTRDIIISKENGIVDLGFFDELIPQLKVGTYDFAKLFFEVSISHIDPYTGNIVYNDVPINIEIHNANTGNFVYDSNGDSVISYVELYDAENRNKISLHTWTDYQTISVNRRMFGVKSIDDNNIYIDGISSRDEQDPWYLRIHNTSYKEDEIVGRTEYPINFTYDIPEYYNQVYNPFYPYMKAYAEKAKYVDYHRASLTNKTIYIDRGEVVGEEPNLVSTNSYKLSHGNVYDLTLHDNDVIINELEVDTEYGIATPLSEIVGIVTADYKWNNITAIRRRYGRKNTTKERLTKVDSNTYSAKHDNVLLIPAPSVYVDSVKLPFNEYNINHEEGTVELINGTSYPVYMDYNYSDDEPLTITDIDATNGVLTFQEQIEFTDEILVSYHYEQSHYVYKGFADGQGQFNHLDFNPSTGHTITYEGTEIPSSVLVNKNAYVYMIPRSISNMMYYTYIDKNLFTYGTDGTPIMNGINQGATVWDTILKPINNKVDQMTYVPSIYLANIKHLTGDISSSPENILNEAISNQNSPYIDNNTNLVPVVSYPVSSNPNLIILGGYLVNSHVIRHTFSEKEIDEILTNIAGTKLLAKINIKEVPFDLTIIDARKRGGGIKESISDKTISTKNKDLNLSYWDISPWDGIAYQKNGSVLITLPKEVLKDYGGNFTRNQVEEYINQFIALGVFYHVEYT